MLFVSVWFSPIKVQKIFHSYNFLDTFLTSNSRYCKYFIPKKRVKIFFHSTKTEAVVLSKESDKTGKFFFSFFKMAHFTQQNGPFCRSEWFILSSKTGLFRVQNEPFWKPEKCKENTSCLFPASYNFLIFRAYASVSFLFWKDGLHFV